MWQCRVIKPKAPSLLRTTYFLHRENKGETSGPRGQPLLHMKNFTRQVCPKVVAQARQRPRFTEWSIAVAGGASKYAGKSRRESEGSVIKQKMENQNKIKSSEKTRSRMRCPTGALVSLLRQSDEVRLSHAGLACNREASSRLEAQRQEKVV